MISSLYQKRLFRNLEEKAFRRCIGSVSLVAPILFLAACQTNPARTTTISQPSTPVDRTVTSFTQAKTCMDRMFLENGRTSPIILTSSELTDQTNTVSVGLEDMVISAISDMTTQSRAFSYFAPPQPGSTVDRLQETFVPLAGLSTEAVPRLYIRGSISQADNNVTADETDVGVATPFLTLGAGRDQRTSTISIDLQLADVASRIVVPGVNSSNTITVVSSGTGMSARGLVTGGSFGGGLSLSLGSSEQEGRGQAVRTLVDLAMIELLGKYTNVPYTRCLQLLSTSPTTARTARDRYDRMSPQQRVSVIQAGLRNTGEYAGPLDGQLSLRLQDAIASAESSRGLVPDGRIDFQIYQALYNENVLPAGEVAVPDTMPAETLATRTPETGRDPLGLSVALMPSRPSPGDAVTVRVSVQRASDLYCYYEYDEGGRTETVRFFPNRFATDNRLSPGQTLTLPDPSGRVRLIYDGLAPEAIACIATTAEYTADNRPQTVSAVDLEPLNCGWPGIGCPIFYHQAADRVNTSVVIERYGR